MWQNIGQSLFITNLLIKEITMKKLILLLFVLSVSIVSVAYAKDCYNLSANSEVTSEIFKENGYEFVGEYSFCSLKSCSSLYYNVYVKGNLYYVERNNKYYRLMPTKVEGYDYNYYYSWRGDKWYVKL